MSGRLPSANSTSTTGPITCLMVPVLTLFMAVSGNEGDGAWKEGAGEARG